MTDPTRISTITFPSEPHTRLMQIATTRPARAWSRANALAAWLVSLDTTRPAMLKLLGGPFVGVHYGSDAVEIVRTLVGAP